MITIHKATINGRAVAYSSETTWLVQTGRGKGSYSTRYTFKGEAGLHHAWFYYKSINIGNGYKKRLLSPEMNKPTLARSFSY
jgi:hypothetical protein